MVCNALKMLAEAEAKLAAAVQGHIRDRDTIDMYAGRIAELEAENARLKAVLRGNWKDRMDWLAEDGRRS